MVTDRRRYGGDGKTPCERLVEAARHAADAGVDLVQIREPDLEDGRLFDLSRQIVAATGGSACRVVVNGRPDIALAAGAHGVHLRATSPPAGRVRAIAPHGFLVGRSVHSADEAEAVERAGGCDYLIFGTVFPSVTKGEGHPAAGVESLARVCARVRLPILAIGGVTAARGAEIAASGAAGLAAIDLFAALPTADATMDATESWRAVVSRIRTAFERADT
jgi:thiamine-phosphate pyrophosphorylase